MMKRRFFTLRIELENDAFKDGPQFELAWILRQLIDTYENHDADLNQVLLDSNGNTVGHAIASFRF